MPLNPLQYNPYGISCRVLRSTSVAIPPNADGTKPDLSWLDLYDCVCKMLYIKLYERYQYTEFHFIGTLADKELLESLDLVNTKYKQFICSRNSSTHMTDLEHVYMWTNPTRWGKFFKRLHNMKMILLKPGEGVFRFHHMVMLLPVDIDKLKEEIFIDAL